MNKQEAIQQLKAMTPILLRSSDCTTEMAKAQEMAISALEKQIPKEPIFESDGYADGSPIYDTWHCPGCDTEFDIDDKYKYCPNCGQRLEE